MEKKYGLSYTELELMDFLWAENRAVTFKELMEYANNSLKKNWKKQTLGTYLRNLQLAGLIGVDDEKKNYSYYALNTREEHIEKWVKGFLGDFFDNSIGKFISAFSGGKELSDKDAEELRRFLK